ncbi:MAG TPA: pilus assembly protein N-terminal domain-containing protein, partial [Candidatus Aquilonibacter sp.]|nr:pilus assembly protein N-terminal domain-containing protein [Candidatus Aquilonibacter sp.]
MLVAFVGTALSWASSARAQVEPPPPPPTPVVSATPFADALTPTPSPAPDAIPTPMPSAIQTFPGETPSPAPSLSPGASPEGSPEASPAISPSPSITPSPTPPPVTISPGTLQVPVSTTQTAHINGAFGQFTAVAQDPNVVTVTANQDTQTISVYGKTPGSTVITVTDSRGISAAAGVRVAYNAGDINPYIQIRLTGDPASPDYVKDLVQRTIVAQTHTQPGAQVVVSTDDITIHHRLRQDMEKNIDVPVLLQGDQYFSVSGTTRVNVQNVAVPRIAPDQLMVSDFPEKLTENGILFSADLRRGTPSRFLYFHYNPPSEKDRRIVLVAENKSSDPATLQYIDGRGGPTKNEMEVGHNATKTFLVNLTQNQGRLVQIGGNSTKVLTTQELPAGSIVANLLQLRVLDGPAIHLTLVAQNSTDSPDSALTTGQLLTSTVKHARGIYTIPEFHFATQWNVNDSYLELPIGQIPLPNTLAG